MGLERERIERTKRKCTRREGGRANYVASKPTGLRAKIKRSRARGVELERPVYGRQSTLLLAVKKPRDETSDGERRCVLMIPGDRHARVTQCGVTARPVKALSREAQLVTPGGGRVGDEVVRIKLERLVQKRERGLGVAGHVRGDVGERAQIKPIGVEVLDPLPQFPLDLRFLHAGLDDTDDALSDLILEIENVFESAIVSVGPEKFSGFCFRKSRRDPNAPRGPEHAAFQNVACAKRASGRANVRGVALVVRP